MNNLPKSYLVSTIVSNMNPTLIRKHFGIKEDTLIKERLSSFSKIELISYINEVGGELKIIAEKHIDSFPLKTSPTLYIINIANQIIFSDLRVVTNTAVQKGRDSSAVFQDNRTIRMIYVKSGLKSICEEPLIYELGLAYEKKVELNECDPLDENFGEVQILYSLENAIIWIPGSSSNYGIIACSDFSAITPIIKYVNSSFNFGAFLPDLTYEMLVNISNGGNLKNATFFNATKDLHSKLDVRTITVYDENLANSRTYSDIISQEGSEQRSGFYENHPDLLRAGIGIARRYGRIWTPAHLNRDELIRLSINVIKKLDVQLEKASKDRLRDFIAYYHNSVISIGASIINGRARSLFDELMYYLVVSNDGLDKKCRLPRSFLEELIKYKNKLKLSNVMTCECSNCGEKTIHCPVCKSCVELDFDDTDAIIKCANSSCNAVLDYLNYICECGESCPIIDPISQTILFPEIELLQAIDSYAQLLHPALEFPKVFIIVGNEMIRLNDKTGIRYKHIYLEDLDLWKNRAHLHQITSTSQSNIAKILSSMKEKCKQHPTMSDCNACLTKKISIEHFESGNVCLLRTFGIPISTKFDGIHHGHEIADIVYTDSIDGVNCKIGIHVKSVGTDKTKNGLGRSKNKIKELYAQIFYSLYQISQGIENFDILGIAIPNRISEDVISSMKEILFRYGISFISIDKVTWEKIIVSAEECLQFDG